MFERIGLVFQSLEKWGHNSSVLKDRAGIPMFERIGP